MNKVSLKFNTGYAITRGREHMGCTLNSTNSIQILIQILNIIVSEKRYELQKFLNLSIVTEKGSSVNKIYQSVRVVSSRKAN